MATKKGPQIYLNDEDPAEKEIFNWAESIGKGRKSMATIESIIAGRAIARICQPIADLLISSARRNEPVTLQQLEDYISMFKGHSKSVEAPAIVSEPKTVEKNDEPKSGFDNLGG